MESGDCKNLDAYLLGCLEGSAQEQFQEHLERCQTCQTELRAQQEVDSLLRSVERQLPPPSQQLLRGIEHALQVGRRVRMAGRLGALTAAVLVLGATTWLCWPKHPEQSVSDPPRVAEVHQERFPTRVTLPPGSGLIAVPVETKNRNVTIVFLYPELEPRTEDKRSNE